MAKKALPFRELNLLAERLKKSRKTIKLSQEEVALSLGISVAAISDWENGKSEPPLEYLSYLVKEYDFSLNWIFSGKGSIRLTCEPAQAIKVEKEVNTDDINWKERYYEESEAHKRTLLELNQVRKEKEELQQTPTVLGMATAISTSLED